jgi:hypothetical protein
MIELRVYCRQLFHFGVPRVVVKVQLEDCAQALLQKAEESSSGGDILAKVESILSNASQSGSHRTEG